MQQNVVPLSMLTEFLGLSSQMCLYKQALCLTHVRTSFTISRIIQRSYSTFSRLVIYLRLQKKMRSCHSLWLQLTSHKCLTTYSSPWEPLQQMHSSLRDPSFNTLYFRVVILPAVAKLIHGSPSSLSGLYSLKLSLCMFDPCRFNWRFHTDVSFML